MKYRKDKNPEAVSQNYWGKQRSGKMRRKRNTKIGNPFSDQHELYKMLYVYGSTCKLEENSEQITGV